MPNFATLENVYCGVDDILTLINQASTPDSFQLARLHDAIVSASRIIDDYCNTKFYQLDHSVIPLELELDDFFVLNNALYLPYPVSSIIAIQEDGEILSTDDYVLRGIATIKKRGKESFSTSDLVDYGRFGYKSRVGGSSSYLDLPHVINQQCAIIAAYLAGERDLNGEVNKTSSDTLARSGFENKTMSNVPISGSGTITATDKVNPSRLYYMTQSDVEYAIAMKLPVDSTETKTHTETSQQSNFTGLVPLFELQKLDSYLFMRY